MADLSSRLSEKADAIRSSLAGDVKKAADISDLFMGAGIYLGDVPPDRKASDALKHSMGWVYACAGVISDEIASMKLRLYQQTGDKAKEVLDHPALDIIHRCNDFTTKFDHFWLTTQYLELTGEAPWFISKDGLTPTKMLLLRPDCIDIVPGTKGEVVKGYKYRVGGETVYLEPDEVVFLRYPDPNKQFRGRGPLQAAAITIDLEEYAEEYNRRFFFNSARPDGVLETDQKLGDEQIKKVEAKLKQRYQGVTNAHKTLILEKGLKWQSMSLSQKDMEFLGMANFTRDKILGIFRVPRTVLGITDDVNRANAEATDYVFAKRTIKPKMERIVQQMNEFMLPMFPGTENMFYDFDNPVPEDETKNLEHEKAALASGWLTINEVRDLDGYDPIEGGDELRVPSLMAPLGQEPALPPTYGAGMRGRDFTNRFAAMKARNRGRDKQQKFVRVLEQKLVEKVKELMGVKFPAKKHLHKTKGGRTVPAEPKAMDFQKKQLNIADEFAKRYTGTMSTVFEQQKNWVLAAMPEKAVKDMNWMPFLLQVAAERRRYAKELSGLVADMIIAQAAEAFSYVGVTQSFTADNPALVSYLSKRAFRFSTPVTQYTNALLADAFKEGLAAGEGIPKLRARVTEVFGNMEKYRADRIARSETIRATNYATEEAWKQSDVVSGKEWLTAEDERTCEYCAPMDGKVIDLGGSYFKRGETFTGEQGGVMKLDYETVEHPPLHPDCRCTLIPVVAKSAPKQEVKADIDSAVEKLEKIVNG